MEKFEVFVVDGGDYSVGLQEELSFKAELHGNMVNHLKEYGIMKDFKKALLNLINEFYEPETSYSVYDTDDVEAEREFYGRMGTDEIF